MPAKPNFRSQFKGIVLIQIGNYVDQDALWAKKELGLACVAPRNKFYARCGVPIKKLDWLLHQLDDQEFLLVVQSAQKHANMQKRWAILMSKPTKK
jgi:hypothetical protein